MWSPVVLILIIGFYCSNVESYVCAGCLIEDEKITQCPSYRKAVFPSVAMKDCVNPFFSTIEIVFYDNCVLFDSYLFQKWFPMVEKLTWTIKNCPCVNVKVDSMENGWTCPTTTTTINLTTGKPRSTTDEVTSTTKRSITVRPSSTTGEATSTTKRSITVRPSSTTGEATSTTKRSITVRPASTTDEATSTTKRSITDRPARTTERETTDSSDKPPTIVSSSTVTTTFKSTVGPKSRNKGIVRGSFWDFLYSPVLAGVCLIITVLVTIATGIFMVRKLVRWEKKRRFRRQRLGRQNPAFPHYSTWYDLLSSRFYFRMNREGDSELYTPYSTSSTLETDVDGISTLRRSSSPQNFPMHDMSSVTPTASTTLTMSPVTDTISTSKAAKKMYTFRQSPYSGDCSIEEHSLADLPPMSRPRPRNFQVTNENNGIVSPNVTNTGTGSIEHASPSNQHTNGIFNLNFTDTGSIEHAGPSNRQPNVENSFANMIKQQKNKLKHSTPACVATNPPPIPGPPPPVQQLRVRQDNGTH